MKEIHHLKSKINSGQFPTDFPHFGGANLIITNDENRHHLDGDIVIYSIHASALSWFWCIYVIWICDATSGGR